MINVYIIDHIWYSLLSLYLAADLEWPRGEEALSQPAQEAIESLLTPDPELRPNGSCLREMTVFSSIQWDELHESQAPFVPSPDDSMDTSYFNGG